MNTNETEPSRREQTQNAWTIGSYRAIAPSLLPLAARLVDAAGVDSGDRVLDVACGTGNVALTAYRRGAVATGLDITPAMLGIAEEQAAVIGADIDWCEGDAENLPFGDGSFDVTLSCLGHMMAPDQDAAGAELVRVTRPAGRIGYTAWTIGSNIGAMMRVIGEYLPSEPDASPPPFLWSDPELVRDRFGDRVSDLQFDTGVLMYPTLSPAHFWNSLITESGPIMLALEQVDEEDLPGLREEILEAIEPYFSEADNAMEQEYRLVTGTTA